MLQLITFLFFWKISRGLPAGDADEYLTSVNLFSHIFVLFLITLLVSRSYVRSMLHHTNRSLPDFVHFITLFHRFFIVLPIHVSRSDYEQRRTFIRQSLIFFLSLNCITKNVSAQLAALFLVKYGW